MVDMLDGGIGVDMHENSDAFFKAIGNSNFVKA